MFTFDLDCNDGSCSGLFYPRRIGRAPRGVPELADGMYARIPQQTKILGAAKLTGHAGKFSFGVMNATTADEEAVVANGELRTRESVEPLSNFSVVRARREFDNQSTVGFITTATTRRLTSFTGFLPERAFTGGLDWDLRMKKRYSVTGYLVGSSVQRRRPRRSSSCRRAPSTASSARTRITSKRIRRARRSAAAAGCWRSRRSPGRRSASTSTPASRPRVSTSTTSASCGAPICGR